LFVFVEQAYPREVGFSNPTLPVSSLVPDEQQSVVDIPLNQPGTGEGKEPAWVQT
jgi:hypothetical protein